MILVAHKAAAEGDVGNVGCEIGFLEVRFLIAGDRSAKEKPDGMNTVGGGVFALLTRSLLINSLPEAIVVP